LKTFGIEHFRFRKKFFVTVKGVDLQGDETGFWDVIPSQFKVFTDVPADYGYGRIEPE
jgi:hypothetical protein